MLRPIARKVLFGTSQCFGTLRADSTVPDSPQNSFPYKRAAPPAAVVGVDRVWGVVARVLSVPRAAIQWMVAETMFQLFRQQAVTRFLDLMT
jgi:hypothetical protein